jgi:hypothetical protein
VVGKVLQTAGSTVSHAGGSLGGAVQQVTGHVPGPGGVVSTSGAAAGGAITGTAGTAGKLLGGG